MREPCYKCKFEYKLIDQEPCEHCSDEYMKSGDHPAFQWAKSPTKADHIRAMTDEELAEQLAFSGCPPCCFNKDGTLGACPAGRLPSKRDCKDCWLDWLKEEATDD